MNIKNLSFNDISKELDSINSICEHSQTFYTTKPKLTKDVFESASKPPKKRKFGKLESLLLSLKLKRLPNNFDKMDNLFYSKTNTFDDILNFEENKAIITELIKFIDNPDSVKTPPLFVRSDAIEAKALLNKLLKQDISKESLKDNKEISKVLELSEILQRANDVSVEKYFTQSSVKNLNLKELQNNSRPIILPYSSYISEDELYSYIKSKKPNIAEIFNLENLSLNDSLIKQYGEQGDFYDLPYKFAIAANNQKISTGKSYIKDIMPDIFKGLDEQELFSSLDTLSSQLRMSNYSSCKMKIGQSRNFDISGKKFTATLIGNGMEGYVYKIQPDGIKDSVVMKVYSYPDLIGCSGNYGSMAIHREATKAGCSDIPKFMMGNPLTELFEIGGQNKLFGGWQIAEDVSGKVNIDSTKPVIEWLNEHGLRHYDLKDDVRTNGYLTDFGYIGTKDIKDADIDTYSSRNNHVSDLFNEYGRGKTTQEITKQLDSAK